MEEQALTSTYPKSALILERARVADLHLLQSYNLSLYKKNFVMSKEANNGQPQIRFEEGNSFASMLKALKDPSPSLPVEPITVSIIGAGQR